MNTTKPFLPEFPVDEVTLIELTRAMDPRRHGTGVSEMGKYLDQKAERHTGIPYGSPSYSDHDVIRSLVKEVRRLRKVQARRYSLIQLWRNLIR